MTRMATEQPRSAGYSGYTQTVRRMPETAAQGRHLARMALAAWGLDADAETAALVMSELVTNAARHARGPTVLLTVDRPADNRVRLAVVDRAPHHQPSMRTPDLEAEGGRGLLLIDAITVRWGWEYTGTGLRPWGKRVWADLEVTTP